MAKLGLNRHIFIVGPAAYGKTVLGQHLCEKFGFNWIDLDSRLENLVGMNIPEYWQSEGEQAFRIQEREVLLDCMHQTPSLITVGGGCPCFFINMSLMIQYACIHLHSEAPLLFKRLQLQGNRPLYQSMNFLDFETLYNSRQKFYNRAQYRLNNVSDLDYLFQQGKEIITQILNR